MHCRQDLIYFLAAGTVLVDAEGVLPVYPVTEMQGGPETERTGSTSNTAAECLLLCSISKSVSLPS